MKKLLAILLLLVSALVCGLRIVAELVMLLGNSVIEKLRHDPQDTSLLELELLITSRETALKFFDYSGAHLARARKVSSKDEIVEFGAAEHHLLAGLEVRPFNSYASAILSVIYSGSKPRRPLESVRARKRSVQTSVFDPLLMFQRVQIGIGLYPYMGEKEKGLLGSQTDFAYDWSGWRFRKFLRRGQLVDWGSYLVSDVDTKQYLLSPTGN